MFALIKLALKNIRHQRTRTLLAIAGISIGIATIVSLGVLAAGWEASVDALLRPPGVVDLTIFEAGVANWILGRITTEQFEKIQVIEGVQKATGQFATITRTDKNPSFVALGMRSEDLKMAGIEITEGRSFVDGKNEVILGRIAARTHNKGLGDEITIGDVLYTIVGIYRSNPMQEGGAVISLEVLWADRPGAQEFTMILVEVSDDVKDIDGFAKKIEETFDGELGVLSPADPIEEVDPGVGDFGLMRDIISLLAVVMGGIGVMNTIMMSVFERTREIGVLRAVGWSRKRVFVMITSESFIIGISATVVGTLLGLLAIAVIMTFPRVEESMQAVYPISVFVMAAVVGSLVSIIGGLYPALRATKFAPTEALRYE
jgi:putative ABC transport system permease protein